ncbi:hypothetical protein ABEW03_11885, partial [Virgibacillus pantothenticus]|uniref:hypothetical protein n=1 Tax=Virgibacillus pantothenticus TaxID=1473 RepID=UPI003D279B8C
LYLKIAFLYTIGEYKIFLVYSIRKTKASARRLGDKPSFSNRIGIKTRKSQGESSFRKFRERLRIDFFRNDMLK